MRHSKRWRARGIGWALCAALALGLGPGSARAAVGPNVLFIAVDDLNDWVTFLGGHPDASTPNMEALAARGVVFERAYCSAPACNPSRASLLTGIGPPTSGIYLNPDPWRQSPRLADAATIPQHFMANGYNAFGAGKIFHGSQKDPASWDQYFTKPANLAPSTLPAHGIANMGNVDWGGLDAGISDSDTSDFQTASWVINKLRQSHTKPFFLACGIYRPHLRWYAPQAYFDQFSSPTLTLPSFLSNDLDDVPTIPSNWANTGIHNRIMNANAHRDSVAAYLACSAFADAQVGRVIDALDASAYANNTIIVFWGDHGWHLGEKTHWKKFSLWEEAARVPFVIVAPGVTAPGGRSPRTVSLLDIYPTLIELCGLPGVPRIEGLSLAPLLADPMAPWDRPALTTHHRRNHSLRSERWRYTLYSDGTEELYDHDNDPLEWTNLIGDPQYDTVIQDLANWLPTYDGPEGGEPWPSSVEEWRQR